MITKEQCRAARSFLNLKQADLAKECGLSKTAITHFESGLFKPRADNMNSIQSALERRGIEFVGNYGVQKKQINFQVLDTRDEGTSLPQLWDDVFETLKDTGGEVLISHLDEKSAYESHPEELKNHLQRLHDHNITERLLMCEGDDFFLQPPEYYRWLKKDIYKTGMTSFIYSNKLALQFWSGHLIMIIEHPEICAEERKRFNYLWDTAIIPSE